MFRMDSGYSSGYSRSSSSTTSSGLSRNASYERQVTQINNSSRSSSSTTSSGQSRNASYERQAAQISSKSSSSTTTTGASREASYQKQAQQIKVDNLNKEVEQAKLAYMKAQQLGDKAGMESAHKKADELRSAGATLGAEQDSAVTKQMKSYYENSGIKVAITTRSVNDLNKGIVQAKNDYAWAQAHNDQVGMAAASQLATNLRTLGGTITTNTSLEAARNIVSPPSKLKTAVTQVKNTVGDFAEGFTYALSDNLTFGGVKAVHDDHASTRSTGYQVGKIFGDATATVGGISATVAGGGEAIATSAGGVTAVFAPAGAAVASTGVAIAGHSATNLYNDSVQLFKSSESSQSAGNPISNNMKTRVPDHEISSPPKRGNAPISNKDDRPIEIHHEGQSPEGPFHEMHPSDHRYGENYKNNHPDYDGESKIDRKQFKKDTKKYWESEWDSGRFYK